MKPGPSTIAQLVSSRIEITAAPRSVAQLGTVVAAGLKWREGTPPAIEMFEKWTPLVLSLLGRELGELNKLGRFATFAFNSSSPNLIQGSAFIEPSDSASVRDAKTKRAHFGSYLAALRQLSPREFEKLCAGVLQIFGIREPVLTPYSADEGIDFYGQIRLEDHLFPDANFPGVHNQLIAWMVGQAKHYAEGKVSTPEIRELVGAVALAKARAFGSPGEKYYDLLIRACDPIFYLFFTTGRLSANAWGLLERSGVVGMDGEMLSAFLADHSVGLVDGKFQRSALINWLREF